MKRIVSLFLALTLVLTLVPTGVFANDAAAFFDVNASDYYAEAAGVLAQSGILKGYPDGTFGAEKSVTRAEMAAIICRVLEKETETQSVKGATVYDDVPAEHWASGYINFATNKGIISGDGNGKFRPEDDVKYEEAIKMVVSALGFADGAVSDPSDWSKVYLEIAEDKGITQNLLGKKGEAATRGDIAVMTYSGITAKEASAKNEEEKKDSNFNANDKNVGSLPGGGRGSSRPAVTPDEGAFSVSFDLNYEGATNAPETQHVNEGECATEPAVQDRDGFAFVGWYTDNTYSELFDFTAPVTKAYTLIARWVDMTDTTDTDGDGLTDPIEEYYGTDKTKADTDGDGLSDSFEIKSSSTDPLVADSDEDGTNDADEDFDEDGLTNLQEQTNNCNPYSNDSDMDGLTDYDELNTHNTKPDVEDTDEDGVSDGKEIELGTDPLAAQETFGMNLSALDTGSGAVASVQMNLPGEQVETLSVEPVNDDTFFPEDMPGYMGQAYDFNVDGEFESATISFEFDVSEFGPDADPVIYYYNEDEQELEELPTTINGNVASAEVTHFSKYILVDRKVYQEAFTWQDIWDSEQTYTDVEIVLVIDDSGSMTSNDRYNQRLTVAQTLVENLPDNSKIGIVEFEQYTTKWTESLVSDKNVASGFLNTSYFQSNGGWTKMYNGIQNSFELFESEEETTLRMMVVLSDGVADDTSLHNSVIATANDNGVKIYTVGLGNSTSYFNSYLKPLAANTGGAFYLASDATKLADIYKDISEKIDIETDSDDDGIPDYYEDNMIVFSGVRLALDKNNPDTDGDGIEDGDEVIIKKEANADGTKVKVTGKLVLGNPTKADTDGDGYADAEDKEPFDYAISDRTLAIIEALSYVNLHNYVGSTVGDAVENGVKYDGMTQENLQLVKDAVIIYSNHSGIGWEDDFADRGLGSLAVRFDRNTKKDAVIYALRGTEPKSDLANDAITDVVLGLGWDSAQSKNAFNEYKAIAKSKNYDYYITGHSLGGRLAQDVIYKVYKENNVPKPVHSATFNALGYNRLVYATLKNDTLNKFKNKLTNFYYIEDIVGEGLGNAVLYCRSGIQVELLPMRIDGTEYRDYPSGIYVRDWDYHGIKYFVNDYSLLPTTAHNFVYWED